VTAPLVPAADTIPTSKFTAVVFSETEEVPATVCIPAADKMHSMFGNGEDVLLWSAASLDWLSSGKDLFTSGLQMFMVDHQYLGLLSSPTHYHLFLLLLYVSCGCTV